MPSPVGWIAVAFVAIGHGFAAYLCARLAKGARNADDVNGESLPWVLPAVASGLTGLTLILFGVRYALGTAPSLGESVAALGLHAAAAGLVVLYFRQSQTLVTGETPPGTGRVGTLLLLTSAAGTLAVQLPMAPRISHLLMALALGAWAWGLVEASVASRRTAAPAWAPGFAMGAAQVLVAASLTRVLAANAAGANPDVWPAVNLVTAVAFAIATGLAAPALLALADDPANLGETVADDASEEPTQVAIEAPSR